MISTITFFFCYIPEIVLLMLVLKIVKNALILYLIFENKNLMIMCFPDFDKITFIKHVCMYLGTSRSEIGLWRYGTLIPKPDSTEVPMMDLWAPNLIPDIIEMVMNLISFFFNGQKMDGW